MKQPLDIDAYVTKGLPKLDAFVRDLRDLLQEYKNASGGQVRLHAHRGQGRGHEEEGEGRRAHRAAVRRGERHRREGSRHRRASWASSSSTASSRTSSSSCSPDSTDGLEFWITNKIREIRDKGDDIHHKIGVLTGHDEIKLTDANLVPTNMGKVHDPGHHHPELPVLRVPGRGPEGRRRRDLRRARRPHHHAAGQGPDREGAPTHRPVRDEGQVARRLRQRGQRQGERRDDERDAQPARPRQAARRLRHRREQGRRPRPPAARHASSCRRWAGWRARELQQMLHVQDDPRFTGNEQLIDTSFPALFRVQDVAVPFASSLTLKADKQPDAKMHVVMRSTPAAVHLTGDTADLTPFQKWAPKLKGLKQDQFAVAANVEGTLKTRLPGRRQDGRRRAGTEREAVARLRPRVVAVPREPAGARGRGPGHGPVRADDAEPRGRREAPDARRALRAAVHHRLDPRVQEHARLAERRHRPSRRQREAPRDRTSSTATS